MIHWHRTEVSSLEVGRRTESCQPRSGSLAIRRSVSSWRTRSAKSYRPWSRILRITASASTMSNRLRRCESRWNNRRWWLCVTRRSPADSISRNCSMCACGWHASDVGVAELDEFVAVRKLTLQMENDAPIPPFGEGICRQLEWKLQRWNHDVLDCLLNTRSAAACESSSTTTSG